MSSQVPSFPDGRKRRSEENDVTGLLRTVVMNYECLVRMCICDAMSRVALCHQCNPFQLGYGIYSFSMRTYEARHFTCTVLIVRQEKKKREYLK